MKNSNIKPKRKKYLLPSIIFKPEKKRKKGRKKEKPNPILKFSIKQQINTYIHTHIIYKYLKIYNNNEIVT